MKQEMKKQVVVLLSFVAIMIMLAGVIHFLSPKKTYGCTIQFVDTDKDTILMSVDATCKDDGQETVRDPYYTHRVYSFEVYSNDKEQQYDTNYNTNHWYTGWDAQD